MAKRAPVHREASRAEIHGRGQRPAGEAGVMLWRSLVSPLMMARISSKAQPECRYPPRGTAAFPIWLLDAKRRGHFVGAWGDGEVRSRGARDSAPRSAAVCQP